jgi:hypothetical protein
MLRGQDTKVLHHLSTLSLRKLAKGTSLVSFTGERACIVKYGYLFQFHPVRKFFPTFKDWDAVQGPCSEGTIKYTVYSPPHLSPMEKCVKDIENHLAIYDRGTPMASRIRKLYLAFGLKSYVELKDSPSFLWGNQKSFYTYGVWKENTFFTSHPLGTFQQYHQKHLEILDKDGNFIPLGFFKDRVYVRGVLTLNLALYAKVLAGTFTLRLSWKVGGERKRMLFYIESF